MPVRVLFAAVEMSPLAKVGGLADVAGALPKALVRAGHDVRVVLPMHQVIDTAAHGFRPALAGVEVETPRGPEPVSVWEGVVSDVPVYLIESGDMFGRPRIYGEPDDTQRWLFFCDALLAALPLLAWQPEALHLNDWHAAFAATRLRAQPQHPFAAAAIVYTIHNLALRGDFDEGFAVANALPLEPPFDVGEARDQLANAMAQGILHSDMVSTVSATYAQEILTPAYGAGLDPLLRRRAADLVGIVNGIDYEEFDPATDPYITAHYSADVPAGRATNREALQEIAGLAEGPTPIIGIVNRLFWQKGADLAAAAVATLLEEGAILQFIVLGTGDEQYHRQLLDLEARFPRAVKTFLAFDPALAQQIYAGADLFLMPSRYEPCGLGQLIAMRYGAVPVVRHTGGLADTVPDADAASERGTGFVFGPADAPALADALRRALRAYADQARWQAIQRRGMTADLSWGDAARQYVALYEAALARRRAR